MNDEEVRNWVECAIQKIDNYHKCLPFAFCCYLFALRETCPIASLTLMKQDQLGIVLADSTNKFNEIQAKLYQQTKEELVMILSGWKGILSFNFDASSLLPSHPLYWASEQTRNSFFDCTQQFEEDIQLIDAMLSHLETATKNEETSTTEEDIDENKSVPTFGSRSLRRKALKPKIKQIKDSTTKQCVDMMTGFLRKHLCSFTTLPLHEIFYFQNVEALREAFQPYPQAKIHQALTQPGQYLNCACCPSESRLESSMPDTCILYQLYRECGHQINLQDLFITFCEISKSNETTDELQCRFIQALKELQLLGLIKPSKRKVGAIVRTVFRLR